MRQRNPSGFAMSVFRRWWVSREPDEAVSKSAPGTRLKEVRPRSSGSAGRAVLRCDEQPEYPDTGWFLAVAMRIFWTKSAEMASPVELFTRYPI